LPARRKTGPVSEKSSKQIQAEYGRNCWSFEIEPAYRPSGFSCLLIKNSEWTISRRETYLWQGFGSPKIRRPISYSSHRRAVVAGRIFKSGGGEVTRITTLQERAL